MSDKLKKISQRLLSGNEQVAAFLIIFFLGLIAYWRSFSSDFQFDDYHAIVNNPNIKNLDLRLLWGNYKARFLVYLTFAINYLINGLNVFGWHAVNFILHVFASFFAYKFTFITLQSDSLKSKINNGDDGIVSLFAALIFLTHPIQTQSVTYIVQRSTAMAGMLCLITAYCYANARIRGKKIYFLWAVISFAAAMLSKSVVIIFPIMIFLYDVLFVEKRVENAVNWLFICLVICLPAAVIMFYFIGSDRLFSMATKNSVIPQPQYLFTQFNVVITYIRLLFVPINQNLDYDYRIAQSLFEIPTFISFLVLILIIILSCMYAKKYRILSFGTLWFLMAIAPQSSLYPLRDAIFEHRVYLGCYGFALFLCFLIYKICRNKKTFIIFMCLIIGLYAVLTYKRNQLWSNSIGFAKDVVSKSSDKARPHNNLGFFYFKNNEFQKAEEEYKKALVCDPKYFVARVNLALMYIKNGEFEKAKEHLELVIENHPGYAKAYEGLGQVYYRLGEYHKAFQYFQYALKLDVYNNPARIGLGNLYMNQGELRKAESEFKTAVKYNPQSAIAYFNLGNIYFKGKEFSRALKNYKKALSVKPDFAKALQNTGIIFFILGNNDSAIDYLEKAISIEPSLAEAHFNLANVLYAAGRINESQESARTAAKLYRKQGQLDKARKLENKIN